MCGSRSPREAGPPELALRDFVARLPDPPERPWHNLAVVALRQNRHLSDALIGLADALDALALRPQLTGLISDRDRLAGMIRSYLVPRSLDRPHPMTVVFAGPTGSGKSTLVNSLVKRDMSRAGVVRPTTSAPVALVGERWAGSFDEVGGVRCEIVTGRAPILDAMVLVDTPDIDSTVVEHHEIAERLVDNADVVVFVTSSLRYADAVPWKILRRAQERGTHVIHVLNRVGSAASGSLVDFKSRLRAAGMDESLITVPEHLMPEAGQRVPPAAVRSLARRLAAVATERDVFSREAFERVTDSVITQVTVLAREVDAIAQEHETIEPEMYVYLVDRARSLDLGPVGEDIVGDPPDLPGRLAHRRWRRSHRLKHQDVDRMESRSVAGLRAIVHGDLRHWMADEGDPEFPRPGVMLSSLARIVDTVGIGWILYARRMAEELDGPDLWLAEAVLIQAAARDEVTRAATLLFGEEAPTIVERARRELVGRLEVVYTQFADQMLEFLASSGGDLSVDDLRAALGAVNASFAAVHA